MNREFHGRGDISQEMQVCSDIFEKYQKVRFDQVKKNVESGKSMLNDLVKKDVKICGKEILSCCQGEFPKSSWVDNFNLGNFDNQPIKSTKF